MESILIIEDDPSILLGLEKNLQFEGYNVLSSQDGEEGLTFAIQKLPDLLILDVMLPKISGFEICKSIRQKNLPILILMLTARDKEIDKIMGLDLGADDYITKPFSIRELIARVKALLRRKYYYQPTLPNFSFGKFYIDFIGRTVTANDKFLEMSSKEFDLLKLFIENEGKVLSREEILAQVWGVDYFGTSRTVDNFITKLRHKLESEDDSIEYIVTARGVGYKFQATALSPSMDKN
ncbi:MAG: response regulator transcription factor [Planctomycetes bacterium]|jgi:DNA-binding response OmpR family regulator|nr:response regulator transcription factor [Planctomycetota bacterium]HON44522.1 response regulator transcription factor [Planctomycetota bacterium]HPY74575.1 response regulator transcription factor [Planctomycetota bacterium]HQB00214.1 response regulator transcription factor [Planctomycetota bacterium]HRU51243.1 response regulator transcription factor [Planctomycetota bacterium]